MSPMPGVFASASALALLCTRWHCLPPSDVGVVSVSLLVPFLSWHALLHPVAFGTSSRPPSHRPPFPHIHKHTHAHAHTNTHTSSISQDKLGFCDFLQIPIQIRKNNLSRAQTQTWLSRGRRNNYTDKPPELPASRLSTWWSASASSCLTILLLDFCTAQ